MLSYIEIQPYTQTWHLNRGLGTEILKLFGTTVRCPNFIFTYSAVTMNRTLYLTLKTSLMGIKTCMDTFMAQSVITDTVDDTPK